MIWLTVRQFRAQAAVGLGALAALAAVLALTGPGIADEYAEGIAACGSQEACNRFRDLFLDDYQTYYVAVLLIILAAPALIGIFWGAPLITREIEAGTHRLVWNQSITRTRWLAVKLAVVGITAVVLTEAAALAAAWWSDPLKQAAAAELPRLEPVPFATGGIVPLGYAAFAFVLGVTFGAIVRKTLPAMAATLAVFAAVQVAIPMLIRPHLLPAKESTIAVARGNLDAFMVGSNGVQIAVKTPYSGAWLLSNHTVGKSGEEAESLPMSLAEGACAPQPQEGNGPPMGIGDGCFAEIARLGYRQHVTYHPGDRYWTFQWIETGIFAVLTLGLSGFCFYWVRRRLS